MPGTNISLRDISDVNIQLPLTDESVLTYDADTGKFMARATINALSQYTNMVVVDAGGKGDYTTLAAAMAAITDASSTKRYTVVVFGDTGETTPVTHDDFVTLHDFGTGRLDFDSRTEVMQLSTGSGFVAFGLYLRRVATQLTAQGLMDIINTQNGSGAAAEVYRYTGGTWVSKINGIPAGDFNIVPGEGYLIRTTKACTLSLTGYVFRYGVSVTLGAGVTMISLPCAKSHYTAQSLADAINFQGGTCTKVGNYATGNLVEYTVGSGVGDFVIEHNRGYYLTCTAGSTFVPET